MHFKLLIVIVLSSFILFTNELGAACPVGYTPRTTTFTYTNPDCDVTVYYCYTIDPMGTLIQIIDKIEVEVPCALDITYDDSFNAAVDLAIFDDLLQAPIYPPCPLQSTLAKVIRVNCWKFVNDPSHEKILLIPCVSEGKCECTYKICTVYNPPPPYNEVTFQGCYNVGTDDCPVGQPDLPPQGKTIEEEWETECRNLGCN